MVQSPADVFQVLTDAMQHGIATGLWICGDFSHC